MCPKGMHSRGRPPGRESRPPKERGAEGEVKAGGALRRALFQVEGTAPPKLTSEKELGEFVERKRSGVAGARRGGGVGAELDPARPCRTLGEFVILS